MVKIEAVNSKHYCKGILPYILTKIKSNLKSKIRQRNVYVSKKISLYLVEFQFHTALKKLIFKTNFPFSSYLVLVFCDKMSDKFSINDVITIGKFFVPTMLASRQGCSFYLCNNSYYYYSTITHSFLMFFLLLMSA